MPYLAAIIIGQLFIGVLTLNLSSNPHALIHTKNNIKNVLGVKIAQEEPPPDTAPPPDTTAPPPAPPPADTSAPPSDTPIPSANNSSTAQPEAAPTATPADTTSPTPDNSTTSPDNSGTPGPTEQPLFDNLLGSPTPAESAQTPEGGTAPTNQNQNTPPPENNLESVANSANAVLNSSDLINNTEKIDQKSITEVKTEGDKIAQTTDPAAKADLLVTYAVDKVKDMSNFTKNDDFTSANFASARFGDQLNQAASNLNQLSPQKSLQARKTLSGLCAQADLILRTVELSVPEESMQDIEINRGQCMSLK